MSDFHSERKISQTRKPHECQQCGKIIDAGMPAIKGSGSYFGDLYSQYEHIECYAAGRAYAKISGCWGEDYMWFQHGLEELEDKLWLLDEYPVVAARLGLERAELVNEDD